MRKILVIEDEECIRNNILELLAAEDFQALVLISRKSLPMNTISVEVSSREQHRGILL